MQRRRRSASKKLGPDGKLDINRTRLSAGDAVALEGERLLDHLGGDAAEVLVFDLAPV